MEFTQEQYDRLYEAQLNTQAEVKAMNDKIDTMMGVATQNQHAIFGHNGTPGFLAWKVTSQADLENLKIAVFGDPKNREDSGMKVDLEDLKKNEGKKDKLYWAVLSSLGTLVASYFAQALLERFAGG